MRAQLGQFGVWRMARDITPQLAAAAENLGFGAIWIGGSPPGDLELVETVLAATDHIPVVTGIVNMWREEAETVAASHRRITAGYPGRFVLGVGVGHREATAEFQDPMGKIVDYLDRLDRGEVPPDEIVLAALGPKALSIAAERTAGAHPYLTTPNHSALARRVLGEGPLLAPEHKVVLETDPDRARGTGRPVVARYLARVNYRNNLLREGWLEADLNHEGSDRLVDALVLHGTAYDVAAGLRAHLEAGADHVGIQVLDDDPLSAYQTLAGVLFG
ncbi:MAG TPA: TIGR03620 family F420-dependent LLM class oxidoreductase [Acidimicrobiia bacterium]|nr:TIGR03620 family F420-dependent LLM class oxidoreductase [Acidimicrobiia bacterium]